MLDDLTLRTSGRLLAGLTFAVLAVLGVLTFINMSTSEAVARRVLADVKLARLAGFADMMHDALRADVLAAELAGRETGNADKETIRADLAHHAADLEVRIAALESDAEDEHVRHAVARVKPAVLTYTTRARRLLEPALAGSVPRALRHDFDESFRMLTVSLDELSDIIETSAARSVSRQATVFHRVRWTTGAAVLLCALLLSGFTAHFVRRTLRRLGDEPEALRTFSLRIADGALVNRFVSEPPKDSVADAMQRMQAQLRLSREQLMHMARHDVLTGLPNRAMLEERLEHTLAQARTCGERITVAFMDLDRFKPINDDLGHDVGDEVLVEVARRMRLCVRQSDMVVRLGGDEFVMLLPGAAEGIGRVLQRLQQALSEPMRLRGHQLQLSCSIGLASYPEDGADGKSLLKKADAAMYQAKAMAKREALRHATVASGQPLQRPGSREQVLDALA